MDFGIPVGSLYLFSKWEGVISLHRQSQDALVPINDRMGYRCNSRVTNLQAHTGNIADTLWKGGNIPLGLRHGVLKDNEAELNSTRDLLSTSVSHRTLHLTPDASGSEIQTQFNLQMLFALILNKGVPYTITMVVTSKATVL